MTPDQADKIISALNLIAGSLGSISTALWPMLFFKNMSGSGANSAIKDLSNTLLHFIQTRNLR